MGTNFLYTRGYGTPQGGIISPILANLYLTKFDCLLETENLLFVRYADDIVILGKRSIWKSATVLNKVSEFIQDELKLTLKDGNPLTLADVSQKPISYLGMQLQFCASMQDRKNNPYGIAVQIPQRKVDRLVRIISDASEQDLEHLEAPVKGTLLYWSQAHKTKATRRQLSLLSAALEHRGLPFKYVWDLYSKHHKRIWQSIPNT